MYVQAENISIKEYDRFSHLEFNVRPEIAKEAYQWCKGNIRNKWTSWQWHGICVFWFTDAREAMLFKLKYVG